MAAPMKSPRNAPWTKAELSRLGTAPDSVLARRLGRTIQEVVAERQARRIKLETGPRRWTAREIKLLGRYFDAELARRLRRPVHHVRRQRIALHIPAFRPLKLKTWTRAEEKLLGTDEDKAIAARLGRTRTAVLQHRRILGIPPAADFSQCLDRQTRWLVRQTAGQGNCRPAETFSAVRGTTPCETGHSGRSQSGFEKPPLYCGGRQAAWHPAGRPTGSSVAANDVCRSGPADKFWHPQVPCPKAKLDCGGNRTDWPFAG